MRLLLTVAAAALVHSGVAEVVRCPCFLVCVYTLPFFLILGVGVGAGASGEFSKNRACVCAVLLIGGAAVIVHQDDVAQRAGHFAQRPIYI
jgi:hypothetical protein